MSITLKIVNFLDHLKVQKFFLEQNDKVLFTPIKIELNEQFIERKLRQILSGNGKAYEMNEFERACLEELDF